MFLSLFCVADLETSNGLPAAGELMVLNGLLIVPRAERAMLNIGGKFVLARAEFQRVYIWCFKGVT